MMIDLTNDEASLFRTLREAGLFHDLYYGKITLNIANKQIQNVTVERKVYFKENRKQNKSLEEN